MLVPFSENTMILNRFYTYSLKECDLDYNLTSFYQSVQPLARTRGLIRIKMSAHCSHILNPGVTTLQI